MSVDSFIPQIWNAQMLMEFHEQAIAAGLTNREYEGDARVGNKVTINTAVDVVVKNYAIGEGNGGTVAAPKERTTAPDAVSSTAQDLLIDQEKSFDFYVDDIDRRQAAGSMSAYTQSAGLGLAEDADRFLLSTATTNALAANVITDTTDPATLTGNKAWDTFKELRRRLNKQLVPQANRVAIVNAEFEALLLGADSKLTDAAVSGTTAGLRSAALGRLLGFDIYMSENLPVVDNPMVLAFWTPAVAYVSQIVETEAMRGQDSFNDRLRGLHVYGGKVIRPKAVAVYKNTG